MLILSVIEGSCNEAMIKFHFWSVVHRGIQDDAFLT